MSCLGAQDGIQSSDAKGFVGWNGDTLVGVSIRLEHDVAYFLVNYSMSPASSGELISNSAVLRLFAPKNRGLTEQACATPSFERVYAVNCDILLIIGIEVRLVVWGASLGEHSDDNPKKPTQFRHRPILAHSADGGVVAARAIHTGGWRIRLVLWMCAITPPA